MEFPSKSRNYANEFFKRIWRNYPPFTHSRTPHRGSVLTTYPTDSPSSIFSIICAQDFKEDVGVSAVVSELQETGQAAHPELQGKDLGCVIFGLSYNYCCYRQNYCNYYCDFHHYNDVSFCFVTSPYKS